MRELLLCFACHVREMPPEMRRQPNTAFARITTRLWSCGYCQTPLTERSSTPPVRPALYNVDRIENIRPASLSFTEYSISLKVTRRLPDGKAPKGTIRLKEDRVFVVDDQLFYLWEEKIGRPRVDITDTG